MARIRLAHILEASTSTNGNADRATSIESDRHTTLEAYNTLSPIMLGAVYLARTHLHRTYKISRQSLQHRHA